MAQTFKTLYNFSNPTFNSDGANPHCSLVLSGNRLYGTTFEGGTSAAGVVFAINTDGSGFTNLRSFTGGPEGGDPGKGLLLLDDTLYGTTTSGGGTFASGTIFKIRTNETGLTTLRSFFRSTSEGGQPKGQLVSADGVLYGTTYIGGASNLGTVFSIRTNGTDYVRLHDFKNWNGANPVGRLAISGGTLYGTTLVGGNGANGTIFKLNTNGTGFTVLHHFTGEEGAIPQSGLLLADDVLYGSTQSGGFQDCGTIFKINTDGSGFTNIHKFSPVNNATNSDGAHPHCNLARTGNTLYGTTSNGGRFGNGVIFQIQMDGSGYLNLHDFTPAAHQTGIGFTNNGGYSPFPGVIVADHTLYGVAYNGGAYAMGTVFSLSLTPPELKIERSAGNVVLTWPVTTLPFTLQYSTNLTIANSWSNAMSSAVVTNSQNVATYSVAGSGTFFRLVR